ncbi:MAG: ParB/RepB/Spo0J family partition protein [Acidimicrobiales bacterium]
MARRSGLGRGLGALIPTETAHVSATGLREIALARIKPNPFQPRTHFDEEALASLVDSIRAVGVLQPVLVRETGDGEYELIAGERRCRAARRAGLLAIPALVQDADDAASLEQALVENLHREDLNPLDEAAAYQQLIEDFQLTHETVAHRVGKSRASISNALRLFQLPPAVQRLIRDGQLSAGHARALLMTPDRELQEAMAGRTVVEGLSVRALEQLVHDVTEAPPPEPPPVGHPPSLGPKGPGLRPPGVLELEELLADYLNTRVRVEMRANRGRVTVQFATLEDLERIYRLMIGEPSSRA